MTNEEVNELLIDNGLEGATYLTDFNYGEAIIGSTSDNRIIYSFELMIDCLMEYEHMTGEEAIEWIEYNTLRAIGYMGDDAPIIMYEIIR